MDLETSPDADTPRPCGVALLECMLERAGKPVAAALLAMAAQLQVCEHHVPMCKDWGQREGACFVFWGCRAQHSMPAVVVVRVDSLSWGSCTLAGLR